MAAIGHDIDPEKPSLVLSDSNSEAWEWIYAEDSSALPTPPPSEKATPSSTSNTTRATNHDRQSRRASHDTRPIVAARKGDFIVRVGDIVALKAERNDTWVAIITEFTEDIDDGLSENDSGDDDDEAIRKAATFMWFSSLREIRDKSKRLPSTWANELYITPAADVNPLETIEGKAIVLSPANFQQRYPTGRIPKSSPEYGRIFICRRGCNTRNVVYTDEFVWEDVYQGASDLAKLKTMVEEETKRGKKASAILAGQKRKDGEDEFVFREEKDVGPQTPRKKRKILDGGEEVITPKTNRTKGTPSKYLTPTHKRIITKRPLEFTPLGTRLLSTPSKQTTSTSNISSPFQTPHSIARTHLHVSAVPAALPCREQEFDQISSALASAIASSTGTCVYISGTPGTGKTATVREVVAQLRLAVREEELDDFVFVEINGLKVADPHQSYALLWEALMGERVAPSQALGLLEREFARPSPRRVPCVVLMDELDQLVTRNQEVMYNFFNWPNLPHSRLIVLAVANTMDLPERTLSNKISSRLGLTRITFQGYTHSQLMKIIESRLESVQGRTSTGKDILVEPDAIQFASRKVAQVSGDARRALDMCRRAVEIAEMELEVEKSSAEDPRTPSKRGRDRPADGGGEIAGSVVKNERKTGRVTIATVQRAIREATTTPLQQYLRHLPLASKLFLAALLALMRRTGMSEATIGAIVDEAKKLGGMSEITGLKEWLIAGPGPLLKGKREASRILGMGAAATMLAESGVLVTEERKGERWARVRLQVGEEEVKGALRGDEEIGSLGFAS